MTHRLIRRFGTAHHQVDLLVKGLKLVWEAAPGWTIGWGLLLIVQGLLPAVTVYLTRTVVDALVLVVNSPGDWPSVERALFYIGIMVALMGIGLVLSSITGWITGGQAELVQDHIRELIHGQAGKLDFSFYESPEYYDLLERARGEAASHPLVLLQNLGSLLQNAITLIALLGILLPYGVWIPLVLLISTGPTFFLLLTHTRRQNDWRLRTTRDRRRAMYYDWMITDRMAVAELKLFDVSKYFRETYQEIRQRLRTEQLALLSRRARVELAGGALTFVGTGVAMAWMVWRAVQGAATLGDLALFYQAFSRGLGLASSSLSSFADIYRNILFLENLFEFLALQPKVQDPNLPKSMPAATQQGIAFQNVTFSYPGAERPVLEDFNIHFPAQKITAIVGANGAGKSTLIKLIARFYDPYAGVVSLDGIDLREFEQSDLWRQITVMFQHPVHYASTARDNIAMGDLKSAPTLEQIQAAARAAGADETIHRLADGYDTMLGKWFGGAELSGGEWQRVALARAFLRQANIVILDEPTSAMDSWAEAEWLARFRSLVAGRTAIIITHRFTTAMQADIIHVMAQGTVIESGTHEELCALGGRYAISWENQMRGEGHTEDVIPAEQPVVAYLS